MLEYLHIRNLALIEDMELEFENGINVLTGETGAGKSFILKALSFLLGDKLSPEIVRNGAERAQVEALFHLKGKDYILKRELIAATGRSRFYLNDSLSSQEAMRELKPRLISHASQHAQQELLQPAFQAALLEKGLEQPELLQKRDQLLQKLTELAREIKTLVQKQATLAEKRELLEMQQAEIEKVNPKAGEEEKLEELRARSRANVAAKQNYNKAMAILHGDDGPGLLALLQEFERLARIMAADAPSLAGETEIIGNLRQQLQQLANSLPKPQKTEHANMDAIEERLFAFAQLKRKLKRTLPEILALKNEIQENLSFLDICALDISRLNKEVDKQVKELEAVVAAIKPQRRKAAEKFANNLEAELKDLGFSEHVAVLPAFAEHEIWPGVKDERGHINWAPNPGQNPQALDKIASGGELSRFLLAMNTVGQQHKDLTFIFDEVDAGVGGLTLNKLADKLVNLAKRNQVILITHWPQLAARAQKHFNIVKIVKAGQTFTLCSPLAQPERKEELARMAGGGKEGLAMADTLLAE